MQTWGLTDPGNLKRTIKKEPLILPIEPELPET